MQDNMAVNLLLARQLMGGVGGCGGCILLLVDMLLVVDLEGDRPGSGIICALLLLWLLRHPLR
jgi:hypothetical protein